MGARLEGESIKSPKGDLISEGIALGSIQIPEDCQPIILLNDRQTLGGYELMINPLAFSSRGISCEDMSLML